MAEISEGLGADRGNEWDRKSKALIEDGIEVTYKEAVEGSAEKDGWAIKRDG